MNVRHTVVVLSTLSSLLLATRAECARTTDPKFVWNVVSTESGTGVIIKVPRRATDTQDTPQYFVVFAYHLLRPPEESVRASVIVKSFLTRKMGPTTTTSLPLRDIIRSNQNAVAYDRWSDLAIVSLRDAPPAGTPELGAWEAISVAPDSLRSATAIVYGSPKTLFSDLDPIAFSSPFEISTAVINHIDRSQFRTLYDEAAPPAGTVLQLSLTDARQGYSGGPVVITDQSQTEVLAGIVFAANADKLAAIGTASSDIMQGIDILKKKALADAPNGWVLVSDVSDNSVDLKRYFLKQELPSARRAGRKLVRPSPTYDFLVLSDEDTTPSLDNEGRLNISPSIKLDPKARIEHRRLRDFLLSKDSFADAKFEKTIFVNVRLSKDRVATLKGTVFQDCFLQGLEITGCEASLMTFDHCKMGADCLLKRFKPSTAYGVQVIVDENDKNEKELMDCVEEAWTNGMFSSYYEVSILEADSKRTSVLCVLTYK
jgi:hypothetical protein